MRAVHYYVGQPSALHVPDGDADQPESAIQHFHDKLLHIRERMKTAPGKQMAEKRHQLVRTAYSSLSSPADADDGVSQLVDFLAAIDDEYGRDT
jgi:HD superfamily phosphodiesterase